jgi:HD-like signal output (HDOD) protein
MPTALEIVADIDRLASMPAVYHRVKQVIDDPNGSIGRLAEAMATDPAMTARILRIVNSPYYGYPGRIDTISRALNILGMQQVHDLVLAWAISATLVGIRPALMSMDAFWRDSVARAVAARQLARHAHFIDTERLFVEGLLSNIGHLVLYVRAPELALDASTTAKRTGEPLHEAERRIVGCDYAAVGAALVALWRLPAPFEEPLRCQVEPDTAIEHRLEATILHVAGTLADALSLSAPPSIEPQALETLGIDDASLKELGLQLPRQVEGIVGVFFPHLAAA